MNRGSGLEPLGAVGLTGDLLWTLLERALALFRSEVVRKTDRFERVSGWPVGKAGAFSPI